MSAETALQKFVSQQKRLLELELRADEEQESTREVARENGGGFFLRNVDVLDTSVGLYGRTVVSFGSCRIDSIGKNGSEGDSGKARSSRPMLDAHRLTVGDDVEILPKNGKGSSGSKTKRVGGVVCSVDDYSISIALEDKKRQYSKGKNAPNPKIQGDGNDADEDSDMLCGNAPYTLVPRSGVEVYQKMVSALDDLERHGVNHPLAGDIILSAFEPHNYTIDNNHEMSKARLEELEKEFNLASTKLDYSQKEAVVFALDADRPISLIHGPPGTGKTTTVAELIRCAVNKKWKVLVTAPSNVAVDNVLDRLMSLEQLADTGKRKNSKKPNRQKIKAVRLGHPARIQHGIQKYSLESLVQSSDGTEIVQDCRRELNNHLKTLSNPKSRGNDKRVAYQEMKSLRKEIRTREEKVVGEILRDANVVLATNIGAGGSVFRHLVDSKGEPIAFDLVIIDEAAQALEASCWISLLRGRRAVLAGDHCQLPPTIKSSVPEVQRELGKTLFERLMNAYDSSKNEAPNMPSKMLEVQYRMHEDIANWASNAMYNGKLISHESVRHRKLSSLSQVEERMNGETFGKDNQDTLAALQNVTLTIIDTAGCDFHESATDAGSRFNEGEAELVVSHVKSLLSLGLQAEDIAVITPYNGQVELLRKKLLPEVPRLEIRSVDGFQGGEREAVILSLVRSSERGGKDGIGFLRDERRLNVAITRAKRHCALICDGETVSQNKFIKGLVEWMVQKGDYHSGAELTSSASKQSTSTVDRHKEHAARKQKENAAKKKVAGVKGSEPLKTHTSTNDIIRTEDTVKQDALKEDAARRALMNKITAFSETGKKGEELILRDLSNFDLVVARELASQLGLGCRDNKELTVYIIKEVRSNFIAPETKSVHDANTSKFSHLDVDDDESSQESELAGNDCNVSSTPTQNNLLKDLSLERQRRQDSLKAMQSTALSNQTKSKKKKKGQKLGGEKKQTQDTDNLDEFDDMAFLDAQIEKVQTSHERKIDAKGKGYKSIINGVLLTKHAAPETKRTNTAASSSLQAKIKAKSEDRQVKKKKGK